MVGENVKIKFKNLPGVRMVVGKLIPQPLPMKAAYWLKRNSESIINAFKEIDKERNALILKHARLEEEKIDELLNLMTPPLNDKDFKTYEDYVARREFCLLQTAAGNSMYIVEPEDEEFHSKHKELMEREIDVTINKIEIEDLMESNAKISIAELNTIEFMLTERKLVKVAGNIPTSLQ